MTGSTSSKNPRHRTRGRKTRALSIPLIVLLTAVALGGAFTLVPRDKELFTRLINDGKYHRAGEFFLSKAYQSGRANGFAWALNGDPGGKGDPHAPAPRDPVLLLDRLIAATEDGPYPFYDEHVGYIDSLLYMSEDQADMFEAFKARALDLKSPARRRFYETLARVALGKGKPGTASEIYGALTREDPGAAEFTRQRVTCLRYASRPGEALDAIEAFAASTASREIPADLEQVRVALAREINRPGYAFDLLKSDYEKAKGTAGVDELMDQLVASAMHAGRLGEIQEICGDYVSRMPLATASWTEVAKAARPGSKGKGKRSTSGLGRESEFRHYAGMLAMWCEWNGKPDAAFDYYLKLAVLGDARALTRCFALDPGLRRQREITALLQERVEHHGNTAHRLQLARLLANEGRLREALPHYRNHVAANRRDTAAWRELGCIHDELSDTGSAASCYERALALAPSDDLSWKLANAYVELDRHQDALGVYRSLKDNSKALESAAILSESLGRYDDVAATQRNRLETLGKKATPKDFLDLAATHGALEEPDEESAAIETGLRRFPGSARLRARLTRAHALSELSGILDGVNREEPFPPAAMRLPRGKTSGTQRVVLPEGYLDHLDVDGSPGPEAEPAVPGG